MYGLKTCNVIFSLLHSGIGWESIDRSSSLELQSRLADGEFWLDETEFRSQFDDITVGYPSSVEGHLKSIYTGECLVKEWLMLIATPESFILMAIFILTGNLLRHTHQLVGRWTKGHSAGGSRNSSSYSSNPKFWLKVCDSGEVILSLFQHRKWSNMGKHLQSPIRDRRTPKHQRYQAIALHMWQVWVFVCRLRNSGLFVLFSAHFSAYRWRKSALISAGC